MTSSHGTITLVGITYDNYGCAGTYCGPNAGVDPFAGYVCTNWGSTGCTSMANQTPARVMHDDANYGTSYLYRGNVTTRTTFGDSTNLLYDPSGVVYQAIDGSGRSTRMMTDASTNYSMPSQLVATDGNTYLVSGFSYSSGWGVTATTGPNGDSATAAYDSLGRPASTTAVSGASSAFAYSVDTQTSTINGPNGRFQTTTKDGFGRAVRVDTGHDGIIVSSVATLYGPCACSPLGKVIAVSQPYAPGTTPVWTTYTYDSSGRTLTSTAPDGASVTRYTYHGNQITVTDPAGKWKTFTNDAMGNLVTVTEPNPQLGTDTTTYTYNSANQLLTVTMPRSNVTQTRTFQWNGADLVSTTNPENGTVTYTYDSAHRVLSRTDAKEQKTQYTYDAYGRRTMVQHFNASGMELISQRVTYQYDYDNVWNSHALGRLVSVTFASETAGAPERFNYYYSYATSGLVDKQRLQLLTGSTTVNLDAAYGWDNEGRLSSLTPPGAGAKQYVNSYDAMGQLIGMTEAGTTVATASYGSSGEITGLTYDGFTETRQYNSMLQLTRMTAVSGGQTLMDMGYIFSRTQNNGRITSSTDLVSGETVQYTYDTLNRLAKAETTGAAWGEAYTYDGFGNLTAKTVTKGTGPSMTATYDYLTNHQVGVNYDANGNTGLNATTFPYDVENHLLQPLTSGTGPQWTYDPAGKRIFAKTPGNGTTVATTCEIYFYGITGQKLVTFQCGYNDQTSGNGQFWYQLGSRNLYFGGKLMRSAGVTVVTDRLGSVRANSNGERMNYFPYGEERTTTTDGREKFGTYFRDVGGVDYADQRYYSNTNGRFLTPDRFGFGSIGESSSGTTRSWTMAVSPASYTLPYGLDLPNFGPALDDPAGDASPLLTTPSYVTFPEDCNIYGYARADPVNYFDPTGALAMNVGLPSLREQRQPQTGSLGRPQLPPSPLGEPTEDVSAANVRKKCNDLLVGGAVAAGIGVVLTGVGLLTKFPPIVIGGAIFVGGGVIVGTAGYACLTILDLQNN